MRLQRSRIRRALAAIALAGALVVAASSPARATILIWMKTSEMVKRSDAIVLGTIEQTTATWESGKIVTRAKVRVERTIKGGIATRLVDVVVPGGRVGNVTMRVIGSPVMRAGDRALWFIAGDIEYRVVGMAQGKLDVVTAKDGVADVLWWDRRIGRWSPRPLEHVVDDIRREASR